MAEICESITEDDLEIEIETDTTIILVKKYSLDDEAEHKCTVSGQEHEHDVSNSYDNVTLIKSLGLFYYFIDIDIFSVVKLVIIIVSGFSTI